MFIRHNKKNKKMMKTFILMKTKMKNSKMKTKMKNTKIKAKMDNLYKFLIKNKEKLLENNINNSNLLI